LENQEEKPGILFWGVSWVQQRQRKEAEIKFNLGTSGGVQGFQLEGRERLSG